MSQLPPVEVPQNEWVDLYSTTGIPVGTKIIVQNNGSNTALLADSLIEPLSSFGYNNIVPNSFLTSSDVPEGLWAYSGRGTLLQIEVLS